MRHSSRHLIAVIVLIAALLVGWQRPAAIACAVDDAACQDHCAIVATSCAMACPARLLPEPCAVPAPAASAEPVVFSLERPVLAGLTLAPDTGPPRFAA